MTEDRDFHIANLVEAIDDITARLKGPMSDFIRAFLVADRKEMRERLAELRAIALAEQEER